MKSIMSQFEAGVDTATGMVHGVNAGGWTGTAADEFLAGWQEWLDGASRVHDTLHHLAVLLGNAAILYTDTERHVTRTAEQSSVPSPGAPGGAAR